MNDEILFYEKEDGETKENPLHIFGAEDESDAIQFEFRILEKIYPGCILNRVYNVIKINFNGKDQEIWFDITELFTRSRS